MNTIGSIFITNFSDEYPEPFLYSQLTGSYSFVIGGNGSTDGSISITQPSGTLNPNLTADSTPFFISSSGNIGIGTTNPTSLLEVGGTVQTNDVFVSGPDGKPISIREGLISFFESTETDQDEEIEVEEIEVEEVAEDVEVPFAVIENVPEYPGCERGSNAEKRKCMSDKIAKFVQRKFDTDLAGDLGLSGRQRISVIFKIDKNGNVTGVRSRAPHPRLEKEAARVIKMLPKMKPGRQRGKRQPEESVQDTSMLQNVHR